MFKEWTNWVGCQLTNQAGAAVPSFFRPRGKDEKPYPSVTHAYFGEEAERFGRNLRASKWAGAISYSVQEFFRNMAGVPLFDLLEVYAGLASQFPATHLGRMQKYLTQFYFSFQLARFEQVLFLGKESSGILKQFMGHVEWRTQPEDYQGPSLDGENEAENSELLKHYLLEQYELGFFLSKELLFVWDIYKGYLSPEDQKTALSYLENKIKKIQSAIEKNADIPTSLWSLAGYQEVWAKCEGMKARLKEYVKKIDEALPQETHVQYAARLIQSGATQAWTYAKAAAVDSVEYLKKNPGTVVLGLTTLLVLSNLPGAQATLPVSGNGFSAPDFSDFF